jgi:hypothetical protein
MNKFLALLLLLAIVKPVFNEETDAVEAVDDAAPAPVEEEASEEASEDSVEAVEEDAAEDAAPAEDAAAADDDAAAADEDAAPSNRFWWRHYNEDYYHHGFHNHYGAYGCCDMNFYGRRACCYNRPWSACCPNAGIYGYNAGLQYNQHAHWHGQQDDHHDDHHAPTQPLTLKTQHSHFDSSILSSSKSTVSLGY